MTDTTTAARANRHGEPCPPWCVTDHHTPLWKEGFEDEYLDGHHSTGTEVGGRLHPDKLFPDAAARTKVMLLEGDGRTPEVLLSAHRFDRNGKDTYGDLFLNPNEALEAARIIEALAGIRPAQLRQLAVGLRAAAAAITGKEGK